jgi:hypothetical protein
MVVLNFITETTMRNDVSAAIHSPTILWAGRSVTGLVVLFLTFDGITKVIEVAPVVEACQQVGLPRDAVVSIGLLLLACTVIYAFPRTAVLGAILLTGYLGGAAAIHVRAASGAFPVAFAIGFGILAWLALILRKPQLLRTLWLAQ